MTEEQQDKGNSKKLYNQQKILIATFFGGPLAAGILIRKNYMNMGEPQKGLAALIIGIIVTILLFAGIFSLPETTVSKIPGVIIPAIYIAIIGLIVNYSQGKAIEAHRDAGGAFYSFGKAIGIGLVCLVVILGILAAIYFLSLPDYDDRFSAKIDHIAQCEDEALKLYDLIGADEDTLQIISFIKTVGIPKWEEALHTSEQIKTIDNLSYDLLRTGDLLIQYCSLRIHVYQLTIDHFRKGSEEVDRQIEAYNDAIDEVLQKMSE